MKKHNHKPSNKAWREYLESRGLDVNLAWGIPDGTSNYHGYCDRNGAHLFVDICSCGSRRQVCPVGPVRWSNNHNQQLEEEEDYDY